MPHDSVRLGQRCRSIWSWPSSCRTTIWSISSIRYSTPSDYFCLQDHGSSTSLRSSPTAGGAIGKRLLMIGAHGHMNTESAGSREKSFGPVGRPGKEEKEPCQGGSRYLGMLLRLSEVGVIANRMVGYVLDADDLRHLFPEDSLDPLAQGYRRHSAALAAPAHLQVDDVVPHID